MATATRQQLEERLYLLEALAERRKTDPLFTWEPHTKQRAFIDSVLGWECFENWFIAANRSGKTTVGAYVGSQMARFGVEPQHPAIGPSTTVWDRATSGWVVSLDFPSSRDIVQPAYFDNGFVPAGGPNQPFIPAREVSEWRVSDQILKLKNGSIIGFKSADSGRKKFQGVGKDWIQFDEEPPKDIYTECVIRVAAGKRLRVYGTCTLLPPEGQVGGVTWVFTDIVQPWQRHQRSDVQIFTASIYDNLHLPSEEVARLEAKYPEGSIERRIRLNGELLPGLSGARAYGAFQHTTHVGTLPPPDRRRPLCWALDFNVEPMCALVGQRVGRLFRVHHEIVLDTGNVAEAADAFRALYPTHGAEVWLYGDATGKSRDAQTGKSDYQVLLNALRGYSVPLRLKIPAANPAVPDRVNAVNRALRDETGYIGVEIDESCEELIADLEGVLRDPRGGIKKTYNPRDPYFRRTHTSDCLGYWITFEQPVTSEPIPFRPTTYQAQPVRSVRPVRYGMKR